MDFYLDGEQRLLQETALRFLAQRHPPSLARRALPWQDEIQRRLWRDMAELGWLGLLAPDEFGGSNLGMAEACLVAEAAGRQLVNLPLASSLVLLPMLQRVAVQPVASLNAWLSDVVAGRSAVHVTADRSLYRHHEGQCSHQLLLRGMASGQTLDLAEWPEEAVDGYDAVPGLDPTVSTGMLRPHGGSLVWNTLHVTEDDKRWVLACHRLVLVAELVGAASAALDTTCEHARTRVQFGRPIGSNQAVKHCLADGWMALDNARLATLYAAAALDAKRQDWPFACAAAEFTAMRGGLEVGRSAIQVHGGLGFSWEHDAHLYLKRVERIVALLGGAEASLRSIEKMQRSENPERSLVSS